MKKTGLLFLLIFGLSISAAAQPSTVIPGAKAFGNRIWQGDVTNFASLPTGTFPGEKHMALDTRTLWVWTCTVSGMTQTCDWEPGAVGAKGDMGDKGDPGDPGISGANGNTVRSGTGAPSSGTGVNGDFYIDTTSLTMYGPKATGAWGSGTVLLGANGADGSNGTNGSNGMNGATWTTGSGVPSGGADGDLYLRSTGDVYQRAAGSWGIVANLAGPPGSNGTDGVTTAMPPLFLSPSHVLSAAIAFTDLSGLLGAGQLPITFNAPTSSAWDHTPSPCASGRFVSQISASGALTCVQAGFSDLSGTLASGQLPASFNATTATALAATPTACTAPQVATGISASGTPMCVTPDTHAREIDVDSAGPADGVSRFTTIAAAITFINSQTPSLTNTWVMRLHAGTGAAGSGQGNYVETSIVIPAQTSLQGIGMGNLTPGSFNEAPTVQLTSTSGSLVKLSGGSGVRDVTFRYVGSPTAAVKVVDVDNTGTGSTQAIQMQGVTVSIAAGNNTFAVDAITVTKGGLYCYNCMASMSGNALGRAIVNVDAAAGNGGSFYGGRFTASSGCATAVENTAAGTLNLYWTRVDTPRCTVDLRNSGAGPINVIGTLYGPVVGTITNLATHVAYGAALPATCSAGQEFELTATTGGEMLCACASAGNAWQCAGPRDVPRSTPPFECSSSTEGGRYYDLEDHELCVCKGVVPAWTSLGVGTCS